jgi:hypothetical protein
MWKLKADLEETRGGDGEKMVKDIRVQLEEVTSNILHDSIVL